MIDAALLMLRTVTGGLLAGHGSQKLFGAFRGPGPEGTKGMMRAIGLEPAEAMGTMAGASELVGGGLTALGLLSPLGPIISLAPMIMATTTVHWGKPIWGQMGGAEQPLTNAAVTGALALTGPGRYSLDDVVGIRVPRWVSLATLAGVVGGSAAVLALRRPRPQPQAEQPQRAEQEPEVELQAQAERGRAAAAESAPR
jgi:putative oxidoreductase